MLFYNILLWDMLLSLYLTACNVDTLVFFQLYSYRHITSLQLCYSISMVIYKNEQVNVRCRKKPQFLGGWGGGWHRHFWTVFIMLHYALVTVSITWWWDLHVPIDGGCLKTPQRAKWSWPYIVLIFFKRRALYNNCTNLKVKDMDFFFTKQ